METPTRNQKILFYIVFPVGALLFLLISLIDDSPPGRLLVVSCLLAGISLAAVIMRFTIWRGRS